MIQIRAAIRDLADTAEEAIRALALLNAQTAALERLTLAAIVDEIQQSSDPSAYFYRLQSTAILGLPNQSAAGPEIQNALDRMLDKLGTFADQPAADDYGS